MITIIKINFISTLLFLSCWYSTKVVGINIENEKVSFNSKNLNNKTETNQDLDFKDVRVLSNRITLKIPKNLNLMDSQVLGKKYKSLARKPQEVYTNIDHTINIAFNYTTNKVKESELHLIKENLENQFRIVAVKFIKSEIKTIDNKQFIILEYINLAENGDFLHNYSFITSLEGKLLMGNMNYPETDQGFGSIKNEIIDSIKVIDR